MNPRRLYRSRSDRRIAGVAGGVAEYLEVDPTVVRVLWILSIFFGGIGIVMYIVMAFIVPLEPMAGPMGRPPVGAASSPSSSAVPGWQPPAGSTPAPAAASTASSPVASATPADDAAPNAPADDAAPHAPAEDAAAEDAAAEDAAAAPTTEPTSDR